MNIPTHDEAAIRVFDKTATPLDNFVYWHEPAGIENEKIFRKDLVELIEYIQSFFLSACAESQPKNNPKNT